jgi:D-proline reductase (dithiol) PrdB
VCALGYYLEREGIMTTGISLVRENTASMQPPRALWVSFPLGRPLGIPGDAVFQLDVIRAALDLLNRTGGPVLENYPRDVPPMNIETAAACPVTFARDEDIDETWHARLAAEFKQMQPWYELGLRRRNHRTLVGMSSQSPAQNLRALADYLDKDELPKDTKWLKAAVEDLKAYYMEAMTAQPGDYAASALQQMFWRETELGAAILCLYTKFQTSEAIELTLVARILAPREAVGATTGPKGE